MHHIVYIGSEDMRNRVFLLLIMAVGTVQSMQESALWREENETLLQRMHSEENMPYSECFKELANRENDLNVLVDLAAISKRNDYEEAYKIALEKLRNSTSMDFIVNRLLEFCIDNNPTNLKKVYFFQNNEKIYLLLDLFKGKISFENRKECTRFYKMFKIGISRCLGH